MLRLVGGGAAAAMGRLFGGSGDSAQTPSLNGSNAGAALPSPNGASGGTQSTRSAASGSDPASPSATAAPTTNPPSTASPSTTAVPTPRGTRIGRASDVPVGGAASFGDPYSGDPALVVQPTSGTFLAFDALCPHAGCTVEYDQRYSLFVCPCHGSEFNGQTGAVEVGPAQSGLGPIDIQQGSDGQLYVSN